MNDCCLWLAGEAMVELCREFGKSIEWLLTGEDALLRK
jgi:hypothetical protein